MHAGRDARSRDFALGKMHGVGRSAGSRGRWRPELPSWMIPTSRVRVAATGQLEGDCIQHRLAAEHGRWTGGGQVADRSGARPGRLWCWAGLGSRRARGVGCPLEGRVVAEDDVERAVVTAGRGLEEPPRAWLVQTMSVAAAAVRAAIGESWLPR